MNCDITSDLPKSADPNGVTRRGSCSLLCPLLFPPLGALKTLNPSPPPSSPSYKVRAPSEASKKTAGCAPACSGWLWKHYGALRSCPGTSPAHFGVSPRSSKPQKTTTHTVVHLFCNVSPMGSRTNLCQNERSEIPLGTSGRLLGRLGSYLGHPWVGLGPTLPSFLGLWADSLAK